MIAEIERERLKLGVEQKALCAAARVHPTTYSRLKRQPGTGRQKTFEDLKAALARLGERQGDDVKL